LSHDNYYKILKIDHETKYVIKHISVCDYSIWLKIAYCKNHLQYVIKKWKIVRSKLFYKNYKCHMWCCEEREGCHSTPQLEQPNKDWIVFIIQFV